MCMGHEPVVRRDSGRNIRFRDNVIRVSQLALLTFLLANNNVRVLRHNLASGFTVTLVNLKACGI